MNEYDLFKSIGEVDEKLMNRYDAKTAREVKKSARRVRLIVDLVVLLLLFAAVVLLFLHPTKKKMQQDKESLSVSADLKGTIYGTAQELIYDALQSTEYGKKANTVAENYVHLMKDAIEFHVLSEKFLPNKAGIVPFQSFLDYSDHPAFSVCITDEKGQQIILSLQEPEYSGSAGTVQFEGVPISARVRIDGNTSGKEYKKREEAYLERLKDSGIGNRIAAEISASDWEMDSTESLQIVDRYLDVLAALYSFEEIEYSTIKEISLVTPEERMLYGEKQEPYAVRFVDEEDNVIIIYAEGSGRPLFDSVIINGALIRYCIYRI